MPWRSQVVLVGRTGVLPGTSFVISKVDSCRPLAYNTGTRLADEVVVAMLLPPVLAVLMPTPLSADFLNLTTEEEVAQVGVVEAGVVAMALRIEVTSINGRKTVFNPQESRVPSDAVAPLRGVGDEYLEKGKLRRRLW
jgi:hypothetical protein